MNHRLPPNIAENIPLTEHTTIGLGGPARFFASCKSNQEIVGALQFARERGLKFVVLGGGSNVVAADEGFDGLVIHVELRGIDLQTNGGTTLLTVAAGEPWDDVVRCSIANGLAGIECLSGIPGCAGATPIQNVGAYGQEVSDTIAALTAVDVGSYAQCIFHNAECGFGYRNSRFKSADTGGYVVTSVVYRLSSQAAPLVTYKELQRHIDATRGPAPLPKGPEGLTIVRDAVLALRKSKSMVLDPTDPNTRSVGSFFTNPIVTENVAAALRMRWPDLPAFPSGVDVKLSAAWLVEHAGFPKGYHLGGAAVSDHHALALVNRGTTTRELLTLAQTIQDRVLERFAITLEREPIILR